MTPHTQAFPRWPTVYWYFTWWHDDDGTVEKVHAMPRMKVPDDAERASTRRPVFDLRCVSPSWPGRMRDGGRMTPRRHLGHGPTPPPTTADPAGTRGLPVERGDRTAPPDDQERDADQNPTRGRRPLGDGTSRP
ncbi:hypothetical protein POF50_016355 [Streptomyces sp. SL13]|uniref:Uncharacterized protein n=1 Tax=Streptantibioticus silvisoli TaxID=2705255 RepID=A0AA90H8Q5_9ACTN|nr:hypothetical protein [Streptantibioticus silvisoli]MDI5970895.1 hypothetical protein [Streptantibioticus silvisoli]